jgi:hypothetical protein
LVTCHCHLDTRTTRGLDTRDFCTRTSTPSFSTSTRVSKEDNMDYITVNIRTFKLTVLRGEDGLKIADQSTSRPEHTRQTGTNGQQFFKNG